MMETVADAGKHSNNVIVLNSTSLCCPEPCQEHACLRRHDLQIFVNTLKTTLLRFSISTVGPTRLFLFDQTTIRTESKYRREH